ncbi:MAG: acyl-CoA dehydrogenase, partial [Nitrospinota bacterium]|nr:acyl-CoA dehydrogenase [Nitrospinota bacterium]
NAIARLGTDDQKDRWLKMFVEDHDCVVSILSTEPETGSDNIYRQPDPNLGLKTTAVKDGDWYVINGAKRFNSLVSYSKIMLMYARTDTNASLSEGATCFILRGDQEGIRYGRIEDKMGWRLYPNGDSFYENVRVHKDDILGEVNGAFASMEGIINRGNAEIIACNTGLCRALFNVCHQHAKERIQGGKPIIEHPTVASLLADMLTSIEVAEQFMWRVAWGIDNDSTYNSRFTISSKLIGDRLGMHIVPIALDVLGGVGIMKDFPSEKLVRDIITPWHGAGTDSLALLRIAQTLDLPA